MRIKFPILLFILFLAVNTLLFNEGDTNGNLSINTTHLSIGILNLTILVITIIALKKIRLNSYITSLLTISLATFIHSLFFFNINGIYYSFLFLSTTLLGIYLGQTIKSEKEKLNILQIYVVLTYLFTGFVRYKRDNVISIFVPTDRTVLIGFYFFLISKGPRKYLMLTLGILGRSLSGILSFLLAYLNFRYKKLTILFSALLLFLIPYIYIYIEQNLIGTSFMFGKNFEHLLTGSGRFEIYQKGFEYFINSNWREIMFGNGYMKERNILTTLNLTWSSDPHNSFLRAAISLGILGIIILTRLYYLSFKQIPKGDYPLKILLISSILFSQANTVYGLKPMDFHVIIIFLLTNHYFQNQNLINEK